MGVKLIKKKGMKVRKDDDQQTAAVSPLLVLVTTKE